MEQVGVTDLEIACVAANVRPDAFIEGSKPRAEGDGAGDNSIPKLRLLWHQLDETEAAA